MCRITTLKLIISYRYLLLCLCVLSNSVIAGINDKNFGNVIISEVTSIYDGDTFRVNIASWPRLIGERVPIRVNGIDTAELKGKCREEIKLARKAKKVTVDFLRSAKKVELRNIKRGKYFRVVADVFGDDQSLAEKLISTGLAYEYFGGKKRSWCDINRIATEKL